MKRTAQPGNPPIQTRIASPSARQLTAGVSAVIACHNSSHVIEPTIKALLNQKTGDRFTVEIIVVDNNCTDDTIEKTRRIYREYLNRNRDKEKITLKILGEEQPGAAFARKTAVLNASCSIVSFIDDDNILEEDWTRKVFYLFEEKPGVGVIGGYNEAQIDGPSPQWFETFQQSYACGPQAGTSSYVTDRKYVYGAGSSYRTEILLTIYNSPLPLFLSGKTAGAFLMSGNDSALCHRAILMGWEIWYEETLRLKHNLIAKRLNWQSLCRMQAAHSAALIILDIYRALIERRKIKNYQRMLLDIVTDMLAFLLKRLRSKTVKELRQEGTQASLSYHHHKGLLKSALIHRRNYHEIKKQIVQFYKDNNFSTHEPPSPPVIHKKKWPLPSRLAKIKIRIAAPVIKRKMNSFSKIHKQKAAKVISMAVNPMVKDIEFDNKYSLAAVFCTTAQYDKNIRCIHILAKSLKKQPMAHHLAVTIVDSQGQNRFWIRPTFGRLNVPIEAGEFIYGIIEIPVWLMNINGCLGIRLVAPGSHGLEIANGTTDTDNTRLLIPLPSKKGAIN